MCCCPSWTLIVLTVFHICIDCASAYCSAQIVVSFIVYTIFDIDHLMQFMLFSISSPFGALLEHFCATLYSFIIMYYHVYVSFCVLLVHTYVYMCPHMFILDGFICCSFVFFVYFAVLYDFMYISVIYICISHVQVCGLYVLLQNTPFLVKILN